MNSKHRPRTKRHCMLVHAYYPVGETRVQREALALVDQGYEVDVVCLRRDDEKPLAQEDGVTIHRLAMKRYRGRGMLVQLLEYLAFFMLAFVKLITLQRSKGYGTVQVHNLPDFLVFAALFPKLAGASILLDLHDLMPEFFAAKSGRDMHSWPVRVMIWQEQLACRFADHVITVTEVWKETLIQRGVPSEKVSVVMNVADPNIFHRGAKASPAAGNGKHFGLIYHGTFTHRYGVDLLVHAVDKLRRQIPNIHLTLLGNGDSWDSLVELRRELNLEQHVSINQTLHAAKLPDYIRQADVGIVPNRSNVFTDGLLPTKLMEYVALGTPVIAARTPTIASYFDENMLMFFNPGDLEGLTNCILALYNEQHRLEQYAHNSDVFNEKFNWKKISAEYVALLDRLASPKPESKG